MTRSTDHHDQPGRDHAGSNHPGRDHAGRDQPGSNQPGRDAWPEDWMDGGASPAVSDPSAQESVVTSADTDPVIVSSAPQAQRPDDGAGTSAAHGTPAGHGTPAAHGTSPDPHRDAEGSHRGAQDPHRGAQDPHRNAPQGEAAGRGDGADVVTGVPGTFDPQQTTVDRPRIERAVREILEAIGEDPDREGLQDTPKRVAKAYAEFFAGLHQSADQVLGTTFDIAHDELVLVKDIPFYSTCEHHLVPFHGTAHIGYIPSAQGRVTGLSKLARLVELYARRPQVQERLTTQIVEALVEHLHPRGAIVVIQAEHMCMSMRGVRKPGAKTVTSAVRGQLRDPSTRAEAMSLILNG